MIKLNNISKKYNDTVVLKNICYCFDEKKIYVIKGPSGCGKTTLLNIISGIEEDYEGTIYLNCDKKIGYIAQQSLLILDLNIMDNLLLIYNDINVIKHYSKIFKIEKLLYKYPNQLSGGERQRVAIIRSLLSNGEIIIADEPTASLDLKNAYSIVEEFLKLKEMGKTIIISTHDDCFDLIADEIIELDYGIIKQVDLQFQKNYLYNYNMNFSYNNNYDKDINIDFKSIDKKYIKTKIKKSNNIKSIIIYTLLLFILFLLFGIKYNFKSQYLTLFRNKYPINTFYINVDVYDSMSSVNKRKLIKYDNYYYSSDNYVAYMLPQKKESIFKDNDYIINGTYPNNENEILVNKKFCAVNDCQNGVGSNITINNSNFTISGIITNKKNLLDNANDSNPYYHLNNDEAIALIPYNSIKKIGVINNQYISYFVSYDNLYNDHKMFEEIKKLDIYLYWDNIVESYNIVVKMVFSIIMIIIIPASIIAFVFVNNEIFFQLYFRKKEIGYLQLFNISKSRIKKIIGIEYYYKFFIVIIMSLILINVFCLLINVFFNIYLFPPVRILLFISLIFMIYTFLLIYIPVKKMVNTKIKKLIS